MHVNLDKPHLWKKDIAKSVDMFNEWFMSFAPKTFRETRVKTSLHVKIALKITDNFSRIDPSILRNHPDILPVLRMGTCPPLAVDRLIGLSGVARNIVTRMEKQKKLPARLDTGLIDVELGRLGNVIRRMADPDIFTWLNRAVSPTETEVDRAATIISDRLCGAVANPIIRNAQEERQLSAIKNWLEIRRYREIQLEERNSISSMPPGTKVIYRY